jgi:cytochrome c553
MRATMIVLLALTTSTTAALSGGGKVTSTEPGPSVLSEETTGAMLETMGIQPAKTRTTEKAPTNEQPADPKKPVDVAKAKPNPTGPLDPRETISQCTTCHGVNGIAKIPTAPNIAGSSRGYIESQLKAFRSGKRENEVMSVIAEDLSNAEIKAVAKWYSALKVTVEVPE